jgi:transcriptional regulator with XRE-family HTH domain
VLFLKIKDRIKEIRKEKGMSTYKLSEIITQNGFKISQSAISKIENGNKKIDTETLRAIAKALEVDISTILKDTETIDLTNMNEKEKELYVDFTAPTPKHLDYINAIRKIGYSLNFHPVNYEPGGSPESYIYELLDEKKAVITSLSEKDFRVFGEIVLTHKQTLNKTFEILVADTVKAFSNTQVIEKE